MPSFTINFSDNTATATTKVGTVVCDEVLWSADTINFVTGPTRHLVKAVRIDLVDSIDLVTP